MDEWIDFIWIFKGDGASPFPAAVFSTKEKAVKWIEKSGVSGVLMKYPLNVSLYEWAIKAGFFTPKNEMHESGEFIQSFTCASIVDFRFENGVEII